MRPANADLPGWDVVTAEQTDTAHPLSDRAQVRVFTLADYVAEEISGKLYVSGAGLEWSGLPARIDGIPSCYLLIRLAFPKAYARPSHAIVVRAMSGEGHPVGPDPLLQATMYFDLDGVPDDFTEVSSNLPVQVVEYPATLDPDGVIFLDLLVDDILVSRLPVQLRPVDD